MTRYCTIIWLLVWKNWIIQVRHVFITILLIMGPPLLVAICLYIRVSVESTKHSEVTRFTAFNPAEPPSTRSAKGSNKTGGMSLAWTTQESAPASFVEESEKLMQTAFSQAFTLNHFSSPTEMEEYFIKGRKNKTDKALAGVELADEADPAAPKVCSRRLKVTLRFPEKLQFASNEETWLTDRLFMVNQRPGPRDKESNTGPLPRYVDEGFAGLQSHVSSAVVLHCTKRTRRPRQPLHGKASRRRRLRAAPEAPEFQLRRFPYPAYVDDKMSLQLRILTTIMILSFIVICVFTVKSIVDEKARQIKETLKMMGVSPSMHWIAWFIKTMSLLLITNLLIVVILKVETEYGAIMYHSSGVFLFVFLMLFAASLTFFCFMISVFFSSAYIAGVFAALAYLLSFMFYNSVQEDYSKHISIAKIIVISLTCAGALGFGLVIIEQHEGTGAGQQWNNIWTYPSADIPLSMGIILMMMLLSCLIYMLIALYFEAVLPGEFGVRKPWNFLCKKSYWRPQKSEEGAVHPRAHKQDPRNFEGEPSGTTEGVRIDSVTKVFPPNKLVVNNLSLTMYEGEITVLLGHNGAGKTTTISMITGMMMPTSGSITVGGYDIVINTREARQGMGLCPQHNVLFDDLTVREHLYFFCKLKGMSGAELKEEIDFLLKLIDMEDKKNKKARTLSGGMKRKLAVIVALCGKSKVVFLDEPTAGMDPAARRALWDLLRELKAGRTLLLTTHMMDEADVLGDRIAIMSGGRLQCYGSPFFLKKRYGGGYHLVVVKGRRCQTSEVTKLLQKHIKGLSITREAGFEIVYQLNENQTAQFEPMLADLEGKASALNVTTFGVSVTTMEEVFLKVGKEQGAKDAADEPSRRSTRFSAMRWERRTGVQLCCNQVHAMFLKKAVVAWRGWLGLTIHLIAPALVVLVQYFIKSGQDKDTLPARSMVLESYRNPKTIIAFGKGVNSTLSKNYQDMVTVGDIRILDDQASPSDALEKHLLNQYNADLEETRNHYIIGASFEKERITGWFSDQPLHSLPLILNMLYNAQLKSSDVSLNIVNYPLHTSQIFKMGLAGSASTTFALGMMILSGFFILLPIKERSNKAKHNQVVAGVNVLIFWGVHFIFDFLCCMVACVLFIIVVAIVDITCFSTFYEIARLCAVLVCFTCTNLAFIYVLSLMFTQVATGYATLLGINILGFIIAIIVPMFSSLEETDTIPKGVSNIMRWIFFVIPIFTFEDAVLQISQYCLYSEICDKYKPDCSKQEESACCPGKCPYSGCVSIPPDYVQWALPGVGRHLLMIFVWGFIFWFILMLIDSHLLNCCIACLQRFCVRMRLLCKKRKHDEENLEEDEDVLEEKRKISSSSDTRLKKYGVVLSGVTKYYGDHRAVNDISVGVKKGESFGLLGVNGAGKTSTFKIMTGDTTMTKGKGYLMGYNFEKQIRKVHQNVGYCPQFDALIEVMTVRETLRMYFLLKGYPRRVIERQLRRVANDLGFQEHLDKKVKDCSGGNKRKVSLAVALLNEPPVVFLDEPTAGMDPGVRRRVWDVVMDVRESGTCVILTSHSMEECEVLCTRLAIMINGSFKCLGPIQHLKDKYAKGYILLIKVNDGNAVPEAINAVKEFVRVTFPDAVLKQEYLRLLTYNITSTSKTSSWSQMFGIMEKAKKNLDIEDYSLGQTNLEQVFLHLTTLQKQGKLVK